MQLYLKWRLEGRGFDTHRSPVVDSAFTRYGTWQNEQQWQCCAVKQARCAVRQTRCAVKQAHCTVKQAHCTPGPIHGISCLTEGYSTVARGHPINPTGLGRNFGLLQKLLKQKNVCCTTAALIVFS